MLPSIPIYCHQLSCNTKYYHFVWIHIIFYLADPQPVITCPSSPQTATLPQGQNSVTFPRATATDNSGIPPTIAYSTTTPGVTFLEGGTNILASNIQQAGTIPVTATATDNNNNQASCTFNLVIVGKSVLIYVIWSRDWFRIAKSVTEFEYQIKYNTDLTLFGYKMLLLLTY